jgi:uncharacterized membrane protein
MNFGVDGSKAVTAALASSLLTFIVFAFSMILLAVQMASGQLSPRVISRIFESSPVKVTLGVFTFSYTYTLATVGRIEARVPQLPVLIAVVASLFSIVLFVYLIQHVGKALRPVMILTNVAADTRAVIQAVYPIPFSQGGADPAGLNKSDQRTIFHNGSPGTLQAIDIPGLVKLAEQAGCVIELIPQVGDFLATGEGLFRLHAGREASFNEDSLRNCVALGIERTLEQDPAFGFRILVDIAAKALSPAINDPTTGALAVDQIQHLLYLLSQSKLDTGTVRDSSDIVRLIYRTPSWEDFVTLGATEIRIYGATNPQVTRRLQAMFEYLRRAVPAERSAAIEKESAFLRRSIDRAFSDPEDRVLFGVSDLQGFGGGRLS